MCICALFGANQLSELALLFVYFGLPNGVFVGSVVYMISRTGFYVEVYLLQPTCFIHGALVHMLMFQMWFGFICVEFSGGSSDKYVCSN